MYLFSIVIGFFLGFSIKGKFVGLPKFNKVWILALSFLLQFIQVLPILHLNHYPILNSVSYLVLFLFLAVNWQYDEIRFSAVGVFLNAIPVWFNGGKMPVDFTVAMEKWGTAQDLLSGKDFKHVIINPNTSFAEFGDIMYIKYPIGQMISIGDVLISLGILFLVLRTMDKPLHLKALIEKLQT